MPTRRQITVEEILRGTGLGRMQSVGQMGVIPILDEGNAQDEDFAPPDFNVSTSHYGTVDVDNLDQERPTILPTGAGWVTRERAQDHAVPSAALVKAGKSRKIDTAMCIEQTQGGLLSHSAHKMLILPAALRGPALALRNKQEYSKLWNEIDRLNTASGIRGGSGHLVRFLKHFETELDEFVAQFELVPGQIGAVVLIGDYVVGVEKAPTVEFWKKLWEPLIRVCYGSLSILASQQLTKPPVHRTTLGGAAKSLMDLRLLLDDAIRRTVEVTRAAMTSINENQLEAGTADETMGKAKLFTVGSTHLAGQLVEKDGKVPYATLCAPNF
jgi:hypothetical protein